MPDRCILGIDSGNTVTKAVVFSESGRQLSVESCATEQIKPRPRFVERDMNTLWQLTGRVIRQAIEKAGIDASHIVAVSLTGHGDGVYLVDRDGVPLGNGVLSLDTRTAGILERWQADGTSAAAFDATGQMPYAPAPSALLVWIRDHEEGRFDRIGHVLSCKDWLRYKLTGAFATDWTEASTSFADPVTQNYSDEALRLFGLQSLRSALPVAADPCSIIGEVTPGAAEQTGLKVNTPVAAGLHDVTASAVGAGVVEPGLLAIVAGSFSINEVISAELRPSTEWLSRNSFRRGEWMNMSLSPASSANVDWFVRQCCRDALQRAEREGGSLFRYLEDELADAFEDESRVVFHPFLYGSPHGTDASAAFLGLQGWHHRGHLMRALLECVVFNHRYHIDALSREFSFRSARLTGGGSRSPRICQLFADTTGLHIETVAVNETGALGAALCGAVATGVYNSLAEAAQQTVSVAATYAPRQAHKAELDDQYCRYRTSIGALSDQWTSLRGED